MARGGYIRTSVGGVVVGVMTRLVPWYVHGCFGCECTAAITHAGGAFGRSVVMNGSEIQQLTKMICLK